MAMRFIYTNLCFTKVGVCFLFHHLDIPSPFNKDECEAVSDPQASKRFRELSR